MKAQNTESVLAKKAVITVLTISQWSARRFDKKLTDEVHDAHGMTEDAGRYNKLLLAKDALKKVQQAAQAARDYNWHNTMPWMDMDGQRLLPTVAYLDYTNKMRELKQEFNAEVAKFVANYPAYVKDARKRLNGAFREEDYPKENEIASKFFFDVAIMPCPVADFRCEISGDELAEITGDVQRRLDAGLQKAQGAALEKAARLVGNMVERLNAYAPAEETGDRAKGVFRDSLVENLREFVPILRTFNITGDPALVALADKIEKELCPTDAKDLRESDNAREKVAAAAEKILKDVTNLMA